jgi:hypothetical protein
MMRDTRLIIDEPRLILRRAKSRPLAQLALGIALSCLWYPLAGWILAHFQTATWLLGLAMLLPCGAMALWVPPIARALSPNTLTIVRRDRQLLINDDYLVEPADLALSLAVTPEIWFPKVGLVLEHLGNPIHLQIFQQPGELPEVAKALIAFTGLGRLDPTINPLLV